MGKLTSTAHEGALVRHEFVHANPGTRRDSGCVCRRLGRHRAADRAAPIQPVEDGSLRMRHRANAAAGVRARGGPAVSDQVLPDRDVVHRVRHRDRVSLPVGGGIRQPGRLRAGRDASLHGRGVRGLRVRMAPRRPELGLEERLPGGILLSTVEKVAGYVRKGSLWPATFGLACCAIEMMATAGPRFDISRFGMERFSATPRQADLMIVAGRVSQKMAPVLRQVYDQMAEPKWVLSMGVCASSGGMFNNYAIVQGVDHIVPVDIYLPGCPPRPEMLLHAIIKLHEEIQESSIGVNREEAIREAEQAALSARPTIEMRGLLR